MSSRVLVPVSDSVSVRHTVAYAVREASELAEDGDGDAAVHFVSVVPGVGSTEPNERSTQRARLDRAVVWAGEDLEDDSAVAVETALLGGYEYLFGPDDYAEAFARYARHHDLDTVLFDPGYDPLGTTPLLPTLEAAVERTGLDAEQAPVELERPGSQLIRGGSIGHFLALFAVSYAFYLVLAGSLAPFEIATGALTAAVVAATLGQVVFTVPIDLRRIAGQVGRLCLYAPYLLWEIAKTNVELAAIALHPDLPLDPEMVEFEAAVWSELPVTTLANSITLTPGDLTVAVTRNHFTVHVLTPEDRENLLAGTLERPVRFVFYGRAGARSPTPKERRERREAEREGETE